MKSGVGGVLLGAVLVAGLGTACTAGPAPRSPMPSGTRSPLASTSTSGLDPLLIAALVSARALVTPLPTRTRTAAQICDDAHIGGIATASATTVHAIRSLLGGHGVKPEPLLPDALRPAPPSAQAAWCWIAAGPNTWTACLAAEGIASQRVGTVSGDADPPIGPYPFR